MEFCYKAWTPIATKHKDTVTKKIEALGLAAHCDGGKTQQAIDELEKSLTPEESEILAGMRSRRVLREDIFNINSFALNSIDGLRANMERGQLGLCQAESAKFLTAKMYDLPYLEGKDSGYLEGKSTMVFEKMTDVL